MNASLCRRGKQAAAGCGQQMNQAFSAWRDQDFKDLGSGFSFTRYVTGFIHWQSELAALLDFDFRRGREPLQSLTMIPGYYSSVHSNASAHEPSNPWGVVMMRQVLAFTPYMVGPKGFTEILVCAFRAFQG